VQEKLRAVKRRTRDPILSIYTVSADSFRKVLNTALCESYLGLTYSAP